MHKILFLLIIPFNAIAMEMEYVSLQVAQDLSSLPNQLIELDATREGQVYQAGVFLKKIVEAYLDHKDNDRIGSKGAYISNSHSECFICLDDTYSDADPESILSCGHVLHRSCLNDKILYDCCNNDATGASHCPEISCFHLFTPEELGAVFQTDEDVLRFQKTIFRTLEDLESCPKCAKTIAIRDERLLFNAFCQRCMEFLCFACGRPPHAESCQQMGEIAEAEITFFEELVRNTNKWRLKKNEKFKMPEVDSFGKCPFCGTTVEWADGCDQMTCGDNAMDKSELIRGQRRKGTRFITGCGRKFNWNSRIRVEEVLKCHAKGQGLHLRKAPVVATSQYEEDFALASQIAIDDFIVPGQGHGPDLLDIQGEYENRDLTNTDLERRRRQDPDYSDPRPGSTLGNILLAGNYVAGRFERNDNRFLTVQGMDLRDARFDLSNIAGSDFRSANLEGANFQNVFTRERNYRLRMVQFDFACLALSNFDGAVLRDARFRQADLRNASFLGAICAGCSFVNADLRGVNFAAADLSNSNFYGANLEGAHLEGAIILGASFIGAKNLPLALQSNPLRFSAPGTFLHSMGRALDYFFN